MTAALASKVCLVTGGASGIGSATALAFAEAGARVVVSDTADGEATARRAGGLFVRADVRRPDDVAALLATIVSQHGRLDCAVNNAGIEGVLAPLADYPDDVFERVIAVNVLGVWRCLKAELRQMRAQGGGAIVNTASVGGLVGAGSFSAYVASKHAVVGLTKTAAVDHARDGVRVNAVCPGVIDTPMLTRLGAGMPGLEDALIAMKPMGRLGTADEVARAIVWLCSDAASFVTGHALAVDGGFVAQ